MIPSDQFKGWRYRTQKHPRDLILRRNMLSTTWMDALASLLFNDASIHDENGSVVSNDTFMALLENLPESGPEAAAVRYCVVIGTDRRPALQFLYWHVGAGLENDSYSRSWNAPPFPSWLAVELYCSTSYSGSRWIAPPFLSWQVEAEMPHPFY